MGGRLIEFDYLCTMITLKKHNVITGGRLTFPSAVGLNPLASLR